ncbi:hypothetical protein PHG01_00941 [Streptococcus mutans PKUSS-HG01]|jgi:hypothetical protein|nr:hypothetical protein SMUFR_0871 [Streptococcus mutans UA159-FR]ESS18324.1 hypothetical protein PHG01_00941 [Streptococcus mutans PKUSS-HG01]BAH88050.1 hypothetical protein SmuNN2025_1024 [Streptococcus mutans NN2025]
MEQKGDKTMVNMLSRKIANKAVESLNKTKHRDLYYILISFGLGLLFTLVGIYNIFTEATKDVTTRIIGVILCLALGILFLFLGVALLRIKFKQNESEDGNK